MELVNIPIQIDFAVIQPAEVLNQLIRAGVPIRKLTTESSQTTLVVPAEAYNPGMLIKIASIPGITITILPK